MFDSWNQDFDYISHILFQVNLIMLNIVEIKFMCLLDKRMLLYRNFTSINSVGKL